MRPRLLVLALVVALASCGGGGAGTGSAAPTPTPRGTPQSGLPVVRVWIEAPGGTHEVIAEVAHTQEQRRIGLMHRTSLAPGSGMLFVFPAAEPREFWMKDTLVALDIAFIAGDTIVSVATMQPCEAERCPPTASGGPADAALEVPAGSLAQVGVEAGAKVSYQGDIPPVR